MYMLLIDIDNWKHLLIQDTRHLLIVSSSSDVHVLSCFNVIYASSVHILK